MGNLATRRAKSKLPRLDSTNDENLIHVPADRPIVRVTIPTVNEVVQPPTLAPRSTLQIIDPIFQGTPSNNMTTELNHCFNCKKDIGQMKDIYIYMDLSFCSDDCRNKQIDKDINEEIKIRKKMNKNRRRPNINSPSKGNDKVDDA